MIFILNRVQVSRWSRYRSLILPIMSFAPRMPNEHTDWTFLRSVKTNQYEYFSYQLNASFAGRVVSDSESHQPLTRLDRSSFGTKKLVRIVSFRDAHVSRHLKGIHDRFNPRTEKIKAVWCLDTCVWFMNRFLRASIVLSTVQSFWKLHGTVLAIYFVRFLRLVNRFEISPLSQSLLI